MCLLASKLSLDLAIFKGTVDVGEFLLLTNTIMKNSMIIILVLILIVVGWVLYFFRDNVKDVYDNTSVDVNEKMIDTREDINETIEDIKEDVNDGIDDMQR